MVSFKKLILCCDGTWQASDKPADDKNVESNVTKMCRALAEAKIQSGGDEVQQVVYYQSGIGTDIISDWGAKFAGGSGAGLSDNVVEAYNFLSLNYEAHMRSDGKGLDEHLSDEIFLFGFSRGAYTVRALAGLISAIGILKKSSIRNFANIYKGYQEGTSQNKTALEHVEYKVKPEFVRIKVIGCWDTVGSLGIPDAWFAPAAIQKLLNKKHAFHDPKLSHCVENAFHALALDEHRRPFSPTLWHLPILKATENSPNLIQCWFPGVHINVGGGSKDEVTQPNFSDLGELSDITFAWMVDLCRPFLDFDVVFLKNFADSHKKKLDTNKKGWAQGMINDSFEDAMALAGSLTRAPGQYNAANQIVNRETSRAELSTGTNEYIHPSARIRIKVRKDRDESKTWARETDQRALGGFQLETDQKKNTDANRNKPRSGLLWVKEAGEGLGRIEIPEYKMQGVHENSIHDDDGNVWAERSLLEHSDKELDMIKDVTTLFKLPKAPVITALGRASASLTKAVLGYLPSELHYWEND